MTTEQLTTCINYAKLLGLDKMGFTYSTETLRYIKYIVHYDYIFNGNVYADLIDLKLVLEYSAIIPTIMITCAGQATRMVSPEHYPGFFDRYKFMLEILIHIGLKTAAPLLREDKIDSLLLSTGVTRSK